MKKLQNELKKLKLATEEWQKGENMKLTKQEQFDWDDCVKPPAFLRIFVHIKFMFTFVYWSKIINGIYQYLSFNMFIQIPEYGKYHLPLSTSFTIHVNVAKKAGLGVVIRNKGKSETARMRFICHWNRIDKGFLKFKRMELLSLF